MYLILLLKLSMYHTPKYLRDRLCFVWPALRVPLLTQKEKAAWVGGLFFSCPLSLGYQIQL